MNKVWTDAACEDYMYWFEQDKKTIRRINQLIKAINSEPFSGIGKPEPLKYEYRGFWSRRINETDRLVYKVENDEIIIISCRYHYDQ